MIILLDTSTYTCKLTLIDGEKVTDDSWQADRTLADGLIGYLRQQLSLSGKTWNDVTAIGVYKGPGSFTGLRIGLTVMNTIADTKDIPIVGETGEAWQDAAIRRLRQGQSDGLVMPLYGRDATITKPRK